MSTGKFREWMPNHLLQWHAIQYAKSHGCEVYDFWGAPDRLDESDPMYGVFKFKDGFNGRLAHGLGAWDYPARPVWYRFYTKTLPVILEWMRKAARKRVKKEALA
jgi:lipid II:glycine glycyltransferase (peptidoglycan interpeptide bridge formation enzyme)